MPSKAMSSTDVNDMALARQIVAHPFGQTEYYFSESQKQLVRVEDMVPQYALNAFTKLLSEYKDEFLGSPLYDAFFAKLCPRYKSLREVMRDHGKALVYIAGADTPTVSAARKRLRRAGATETHLHGEFVEGIIDLDLNVTVNVVSNATS